MGRRHTHIVPLGSCWASWGSSNECALLQAVSAFITPDLQLWLVFTYQTGGFALYVDMLGCLLFGGVPLILHTWLLAALVASEAAPL